MCRGCGYVNLVWLDWGNLLWFVVDEEMQMGDLEKVMCKVQEFWQCEQEILDVVLILFLEQGEDCVMVENIVDWVGIGKGIIYKYFEIKNQIYLLLMFCYEEDLVLLFQDIFEFDDKEILVCEYFCFWISDLVCYQLFDWLENKVIKDYVVLELVDKLYCICEVNFEKFNYIVEVCIQEGFLELVFVIYYICFVWVLVYGVVVLMQLLFYQCLIEDKDDFFDFLIEIGICMGNKGQCGK